MASSSRATDGGGRIGPVLDRLDELREDSTRAGVVYDYVESAHALDANPQDFLHVLRSDEALALELRGGMGRDVIAAAEDDHGDVRYRVWTHDAVAARVDEEPVQSEAWQHLRDVKPVIEDREPLVRVRDETILADLEVPERFRDLEQPGRVTRGP